MDPKECLRQTKERCCIINNYSAGRIDYTEVPTTSFQLETIDTPPDTHLSSRSLPVSLLAPSLSKMMKSEPSRRRTYKQLEEYEMKEMKAKLRNKERKGER